MTGTTALVYDEAYLSYQFGPEHPFQPTRLKYTLDLIKELKLLNGKAMLYSPKAAGEEDLHSVHSPDYVDTVKRMSALGRGFLDSGETPATKGIFEASCSVVGGSILGVDLLMEGEVGHAFNPGGGLHHAKTDRTSGFCVFNDIAIVVRRLQRRFGVGRMAIIDIDGHHADGTQEIFYKEPFLKISTHRFGIAPYTGRVEEMGEGEGRGHCVNIPLPRSTGDDAYLYAFHEVVPPLIERYEPEVILLQFGVDGHYQDPLVGLALTTRTYEEVSSTVHRLAHRVSGGRLMVFGGGGYVPANVARCWAIMFATVSGALPASSMERYKGLFDAEAPKTNEEALGRLEVVVRWIKENIFPFHGLGASSD